MVDFRYPQQSDDTGLEWVYALAEWQSLWKFSQAMDGALAIIEEEGTDEQD